MQIDEYLVVCLMFSVAFIVHSIIVARAGADKCEPPVEVKSKSVVEKLYPRNGLLNVRIQCSRLT